MRITKIFNSRTVNSVFTNLRSNANGRLARRLVSGVSGALLRQTLALERRGGKVLVKRTNKTTNISKPVQAPH